MKIAILPSKADVVNEYVAQIHTRLKSLGIEMLLTSEKKHVLGHLDCTWYDEINEMMAACDICVGVGGDGTIIGAAKHAYEYNKSVFGVNCGRLGYLSALESNELDKLSMLVEKKYTILQRMLLSIVIHKENGETIHKIALNDAVFGKENIGKTIDVRVVRDKTVVTGFRGDGVIFASPTGSTAYAMSAGGPIIDPKLEAISVTPICSHSFGSKTMIFSCPTRLSVNVSSSGTCAFLTIDGEQDIPIAPKDCVIIEKCSKSVDFIVFNEFDFNQILNRKFDIPAI